MTLNSKALDESRYDLRAATDSLVAVAYKQLRAIAHRHLSERTQRPTMGTGDLVHEAYLKLSSSSGQQFENRTHFLSLASVAMRHVLVDRAKARVALKRGGHHRSTTFDEDVLAIADDAELLLEIDDALDRLAEIEPRLARVVECRFYGGLTELEIAEALNVTVRTVERDWKKARMLLRSALAP